jgi:hypothetical protein
VLERVRLTEHSASSALNGAIASLTGCK